MEYRELFWEEHGINICLEFKINFITNEASIYYRNKDGGFTTRGIIMEKEVMEHLVLQLAKGKIEQFRDNYEQETTNVFLKMEDYNWKFMVSYSDGKSPIIISNEEERYLTNKEIVIPAFIKEIRKFVVKKLALEDF